MIFNYFFINGVYFYVFNGKNLKRAIHSGAIFIMENLELHISVYFVRYIELCWVPRDRYKGSYNTALIWNNF